MQPPRHLIAAPRQEILHAKAGCSVKWTLTRLMPKQIYILGNPPGLVGRSQPGSVRGIGGIGLPLIGIK